MSGEQVLYHSEDQISMVTINRPEKLNAMNADVRRLLPEILERADNDTSTSVVILKGQGKSFCAGFDIGGDPERDKWRSDALRWHTYLLECLQLVLKPWSMRKPVIASVRGHALGGGCELAMACDFTLASVDASFGEPEVRFSSVGPAVILPWLIGYKKARELLYFGDTIGAEEAMRLGMLNRVYPNEQLDERTIAFARRLALISKETLIGAKMAINRGADASGFSTAMECGVDVLAPLYATSTEDRRRFRELVNTQGLGAALKWRRDQFAGEV